MPTRDELKMLQALPLDLKVRRTQQRIREWVDYFGKDGVYVSFSGGKDSTVLLHLVREMYGNDIPAVFVNTGLEYPEIQRFVRGFENVEILTPKKNFREVISEYGYPLIGKEVGTLVGSLRIARAAGKNIEEFERYKKLKGTLIDKNTGKLSAYNRPKYFPLLDADFNVSDRCCSVMKKAPAHSYETHTKRKPIIATMAQESRLREQKWLLRGCNAFDGHTSSNPMSFWTEQDVLQYIKENNLEIASVYGDIVDNGKCGLKCTGCHRTGCIYCGFGAHLDKESRFVRLKQTHPKHYDFCINGGAYDEHGIWKPNADGLGMGHVFDEMNDMFGKEFIKYK